MARKNKCSTIKICFAVFYFDKVPQLDTRPQPERHGCVTDRSYLSIDSITTHYFSWQEYDFLACQRLTVQGAYPPVPHFLLILHRTLRTGSCVAIDYQFLNIQYFHFLYWQRSCPCPCPNHNSKGHLPVGRKTVGN